MKKILYIMIGCISLGLGIIGVILPILPTVPFVLLAAFCFAKSSERLDGWFKNTKLYRENNIKSGMTKRAKLRIMCSVTLLMGIGFIMMGLKGIVAHKKHVSEITELTAQERAAYMEDINRVACAMHEIFNPDKVNYGAYGDTGHHLHFHLVPKYKDGYEWGGVFAMNPGEKTLSDEEYQDMVEKYRAVLCK